MWEELAGRKGMRYPHLHKAQEALGGGEEPSRGRFFVIEKGGKMHIFPYLAPTPCKHGRTCMSLLWWKPTGSLSVDHFSAQSL